VPPITFKLCIIIFIRVKEKVQLAQRPERHGYIAVFKYEPLHRSTYRMQKVTRTDATLICSALAWYSTQWTFQDLSCAQVSDTWYLRCQMWADKLTSMQRRYKNDLISVVKNVFSFSF
jgi:hypothetical protein